MTLKRTVDQKPLLLLDPFPRTEEMLLSDGTKEALSTMARIESHFGSRAPDAFIEAHLQDASILIGQSPMPKARLARAQKLRAIINVKGNWEPNIDYAAAQARGIYVVLSIAPTLAEAVAEYLLGLALDLARGITQAHIDFTKAQERYGFAGNRAAYTLMGAQVGLIGFGNLGRALLPLLRPFTPNISVYDPWLSPLYLANQGVRALSLESLLKESQFIFILAGVTAENTGFLDRAHLSLIREDTSVILGSRAETVAFDDFVHMAAEGRFRAAIDVFPEEPMPVDAALRHLPNLLFSAHRAGGIEASYRKMRHALVDDVRQILQGLPPQLLQRAEPSQAILMRSR